MFCTATIIIVSSPTTSPRAPSSSSGPVRRTGRASWPIRPTSTWRCTQPCTSREWRRNIIYYKLMAWQRRRRQLTTKNSLLEPLGPRCHVIRPRRHAPKQSSPNQSLVPMNSSHLRGPHPRKTYTPTKRRNSSIQFPETMLIPSSTQMTKRCSSLVVQIKKVKRQEVQASHLTETISSIVKVVKLSSRVLLLRLKKRFQCFEMWETYFCCMIFGLTFKYWILLQNQFC